MKKLEECKFFFSFAMINIFYIAYMTCCAVGIILNGIGLLLLFNYKYAGIDSTQRYILINLCCIDLSLSIILTINETLDVFKVSYGQMLTVCIKIFNIGYYCTTFWLTIDRYLHIKLNIRYVIYCSKKKILIVTIVVWIFSALTGSSIEIYHVKYNFVVYAVFDLIIILFSSYVYTYALVLFKKKKANIRSNQGDKGIFKGLAISISIIVAFAVLVAVPDTIYAIASIKSNFNFNEKEYLYAWIVFPISLWTDASIYILLSPKVRFVLKTKLKYLFGNERNTPERNESYYINS